MTVKRIIENNRHKYIVMHLFYDCKNSVSFERTMSLIMRTVNAGDENFCAYKIKYNKTAREDM